MINIILATIVGIVAFDAMTALFTILLGPVIGSAVSLIITVIVVTSIVTRIYKNEKN